MLPIHLILHARPPGVPAGPARSTSSGTIKTLTPRSEHLGHPLPVTFEQTEETFGALPRMFVEPDGSLVWVSDDPATPWQLDGMLLDRNGKMLCVELKGTAPITQWEQIFQALGWPETELMFELPQEAAWIDEAAFRDLVRQK